MLEVGTNAPPFSAKDQFGELVELSALKGKWIFLYFYPKDNTPGCTHEACGIRDAWSQISRLATVLGVSADDETSHKEFSNQHNLPFQLLADTDKKILNDYHAWGKKQVMGQEFEGILRISYIIDPAGIIAKVYPQVNPEEHTTEVIQDLESLQATTHS